MTALATRPVEEGELVRVADALSMRFGLRLSAQGRAQLPETLGAAAAAACMPVSSLVRAVLAGHGPSLAAVVERTVVGETYFLRHREQLDAAVRAAHALAGPERLVAWSAGCSFGEEPYSLAMLLLERGRDARLASVLGTDLSSRAIARARAAVYGEWSFRGVEAGFIERHFEAAPEGRSLKARVRAMVELRQHNLAGDSLALHGAHLVLCRNVLIYFEPDVALRVMRDLFEAVVPGGFLAVGPAEQPFAEAAGFEWGADEQQLLLRRPLVSPEARPSSPTPSTPRQRVRRILTPPGGGPAARPPPSSPSGSFAAVGPRPTPPGAEAARPASPPLAPAREAAARGDLEVAERLAREAAAQHLLPEAWLLVAMLAEQRGDEAAALEATRHALYLAPDLAQAHLAQLALYRRAGQRAEAERARRNALAAVATLDDAALLRGVEPLTVGALRRALEEP